MGIPLEEIGSGRQRDHAARSLGRSEMEVTQLFDSLCPRLDELEQKLATPSKERPQEAGDSQDDVAAGARSSVRSHADRRSCFFFSHDGQNERPRQENATTKLSRQDSQ